MKNDTSSFIAVDDKWIHQGFFTLEARTVRYTLTQAIRDCLSEGIRHPLRIKRFPVGPKPAHAFMWRTEAREYAEIQFFMRIAADYPVLSLGLYVEKGFENAQRLTAKRRKTHLMDRRTWDWTRFVGAARWLFAEELPARARELGRPIFVRISTFSNEPDAVRPSEHDATFAFAGSQWLWRRRGSISPGEIVQHIKAIDRTRSLWVNLYMSDDLLLAEAHGLTAPEVAHRLMAFETIRQRIHR